MNPLIVFGGTFDPIHNGHLGIAEEVLRQIPEAKLVFLPCKTPVLKQASTASAKDRVSMLQCALADSPLCDKCRIDTREITRDGPSWMVDTLVSLREEYGENTSITLLMGQDAFAGLAQWHQWQSLTTRANLLIAARDEAPALLPEVVRTLWDKAENASAETLSHSPFGRVMRINAGKYPISSTQVREALYSGKAVNNLLPQAVQAYILQNGLYNHIIE